MGSLQVKKLQDRIEKLRAENKRYRETNRTAEFEAAVAALQRQVLICHPPMMFCGRPLLFMDDAACLMQLRAPCAIAYCTCAASTVARGQRCTPCAWQVEAANAAKVAAQQEAHELRLKMRETDGEFTSDGKR